MSNKEYLIQLADKLPSDKLSLVIAYMQGMLDYENADDEFCESLIKDYENSKKKDFISFEEAAKFCGVKINE